jgi:drug/metabolite transporter (DMT)-like permease
MSLNAPPALSPASRPAAGAPALSLGAGAAILVSLSFLWGGNWPAMKLAVAEVPVLSFRVICLFGGGFGMYALARLGGLSFRIPRGELRALLIVAFFNITIWHVCSAAALLYISAGRAAIIAYTMPLWATLLSVHLLGERLRLSTILGLAAGLAGMAALVLPDWRALIADPRGPLLMLAAAMAWAAGTVGMKYYRFTMPVVTVVGWQLLLGGAPILLAALMLDPAPDPTALSIEGWLALAYVVVVAMVYCHWAWFKLVRSFSAVTVSIASLAIPVVGVISGALVLGEGIGADVVAALLLVIFALFLVLIWPLLRQANRVSSKVSQQ